MSGTLGIMPPKPTPSYRPPGKSPFALNRVDKTFRPFLLKTIESTICHYHILFNLPYSVKKRFLEQYSKTRLLPSRLLFTSSYEHIKANPVDLEHLEPRPRQVTVSLALSSPNTLDNHLVMLVHKVERSVTRKESCYHCPILDQLGTNTLSYCTVGLAAFNANLLQHDPSTLWSTLQRVRFDIQAEHPPLVRWIRPSENRPPLSQFASGEQPS